MGCCVLERIYGFLDLWVRVNEGLRVPEFGYLRIVGPLAWGAVV